MYNWVNTDNPILIIIQIGIIIWIGYYFTNEWSNNKNEKGKRKK